jgi:hypothetical protein
VLESCRSHTVRSPARLGTILDIKTILSFKWLKDRISRTQGSGGGRLQELPQMTTWTESNSAQRRRNERTGKRRRVRVLTDVL